MQPVVRLSMTVEYPLYERTALLVEAAGGKLADPVFTDRVALQWQMRAGTQAPLLDQLRELTPRPGQGGGIPAFLRTHLNWKIFPAPIILPLVTRPLW